MKRLLGSLVAVALATLILIPACEDDPAAPTTGSVAGTVAFEGATWPSTGDIQVSLWANFPPMGAPDAFTEPIAQTTSYDYRFDGLPPGTYAAVLVGWRDPALPPGNDVTIGFYWAYVDSVAVDDSGVPQGPPLPVNVSAGAVGDADITANLDAVP